MKKTLVVASLLALGTSAMATDVQGFIGAGLGASWDNVESSYNISGAIVNDSDKEKNRESGFLMSIKGGVIINDTHRLALSYNPSIHSDANVHNILASYDYLIPVNADNRFYVGIHAGTSKLKGKDDFSGLSMSGFAYGAQLGYIHDITKNVEFEFGAMYTKHNAKKTASAVEAGHNIKAQFKLKDSISTLVGINYKF